MSYIMSSTFFVACNTSCKLLRNKHLYRYGLDMDSTERAIIAERVLAYKRKNTRGGLTKILEECDISRPTLKTFLENPDGPQDDTVERIKPAGYSFRCGCSCPW